MMGDLKLFIEFLQRSRYNSIGGKEFVEIENCKEVESYGRGTIAKIFGFGGCCVSQGQ